MSENIHEYIIGIPIILSYSHISIELTIHYRFHVLFSLDYSINYYFLTIFSPKLFLWEFIDLKSSVDIYCPMYPIIVVKIPR